MFDIELLRTFVTVAELRNFTRASIQLHLTQSTISQHIKRLEETVGQSLFQRTTRSIELTDTGGLLLAYARQITDLEQEARDALDKKQQDITIRIGAPEDVARGLLMEVMADLGKQFPRVRWELTVDLSNKLRTLYEHGSLDIIVVKQKGEQGGTHIRPEPLVWIDSIASPSFRERPLPLIVFPANGLYRNEIFRYLDGVGMSWNIRLSASSLSSIQAAVAHGIGISLIPRSAVLEKRHLILKEHHGFHDLPAMELALYMPAKASREFRIIAERIMEIGKQQSVSLSATAKETS